MKRFYYSLFYIKDFSIVILNKFKIAKLSNFKTLMASPGARFCGKVWIVYFSKRKQNGGAGNDPVTKCFVFTDK